MDYSNTYSQQQKAYKTAILWIKYALDHDHIINTLKRSREKFELLSENNPDIDTYDQMISALTVLISNYEYKGWSIERIRDYLKKLMSHYSKKLKNLKNDEYSNSFGKLKFNQPSSWNIVTDRARNHFGKPPKFNQPSSWNIVTDRARNRFGAKTTYNPKLTPEENYKRLRNGFGVKTTYNPKLTPEENYKRLRNG